MRVRGGVGGSGEYEKDEVGLQLWVEVALGSLVSWGSDHYSGTCKVPGLAERVHVMEVLWCQLFVLWVLSVVAAPPPASHAARAWG